MRRIRKAAAPIAALVALLALVSCQQVFTFPVLGFLARDPSLDPDMSLAELLEVAEIVVAEGDTDLAPLVLDRLLEEINSGGLTPAQQEEALRAAVEVAIVECGVSALLSQVMSLVPADPADLTPEIEQEIIDVMLGMTLSQDAKDVFAMAAALPAVAGDGNLFVAAIAALMDAADPSGTAEPGSLALYNNLRGAITVLSESATSLVDLLESEV